MTLACEPLAVFACHCTHCQKTSGAAFSVVVLAPDAGLSMTGAVNVYQDRGDSGQAVLRSFCETCGSPVETASDETQAQGVRLIKGGLFAGRREFAPQVEIFCDRRLSWVPALKDTATFAGMQPH